MKFLIIIAMVATTLAYGQAKPEDAKPVEPKPESWEAANIPVKTLTSEDSFNRLLRLLNIFSSNARYAGDSQLKTISVYGPKQVVDQIRHIIQDLDKPGTEAAIGRNMDMTMTFLKCSNKPAATPTVLSADMEPVARQLRAASLCKDVQIWDYVPLHLQEGKDSSEDMQLPGTFSRNPGASARAEIRIHPDSVYTKASGRFVRFGKLQVSFRIPVASSSPNSDSNVHTQFTYSQVGINTAGDFLEGQKTVLGKLSGMEEEGAIFVVIALKVLD